MSVAQTPTLRIYSADWCADCRVAKRYLDERGIAYEEVNIDTVPGAADEVIRLAGGHRTVPTFVIGERVVVDWDRAALDAALAAEPS